MPSTVSRFRPGGALLGAAGAIAGVVAIYAVVIERNAYRVRVETLPVLAPGAEPIVALQLADAHLAPWQRGRSEFIRSLAQLEPDLVINTGDTLGHHRSLDLVAETFAPFEGVPGVFVHGSNDFFGPMLKNPLRYLGMPALGREHSERILDTASLEAIYADLGWCNLNNRALALPIRNSRLIVFGVNDAHIGYDDLAKVHAEVEAVQEDAEWPRSTAGAPVTLALTHSPYRRILNDFTTLGADVIVAGHTHGGQVRIPGGPALVTNCDIDRLHADGLHRWHHAGKRSWLNVSQGIGTSIFAPFRLGTPPEAVVLNLVANDTQ